MKMIGEEENGNKPDNEIETFPVSFDSEEIKEKFTFSSSISSQIECITSIIH